MVYKNSLKNNSGISNTVVLLVFLAVAITGYFLLHNLKSEKSELKRNLYRALQQKEEINFRLNDVQSAIGPLNNEIKNLRSALIKVARGDDSEGSTLKDRGIAENVSAVKGSGKTDKKTQSAPGRKTDTASNLTRLKDYIKKMEEDNNMLNAKVDTLNNTLVLKEDELLKISQDNAKLKQDFAQAAASQGQLRLESSRGNDQLNNYKTQYQQKEAELAGYNALRVKLEEKIDKLNNEVMNLRGENVSLEKEIMKAQSARGEFESELGKIKDALQRELILNDALKQKVQESDFALGKKEQERSALVKELDAIRELKEKLTVELDEIKLSKSGSTEEVNRLNSKIAELNSSYDSLRNTVSQLSNILAKKDSEISAGQSELVQLKEELGSAAKEKESLRLILENKEKSILQMESSLKKMGSEINILQTEIALTKDQQEKTMKQLAEATSINTSLQDRLRAISKELEPSGVESAFSFDREEADKLRKKVEVKLDFGEENDGQGK